MKKEEIIEQTKNNVGTSFFYDIASVMTSAVVTIAIVFSLLFRIVGVSGQSMESTLFDGDWLIVSAYDANPKDGQVIIVTQPNDFDEPIVKRIIATEGQTIDIDPSSATVTVDGVVLDEPYINNPTIWACDWTEMPYTVPEGHVFVMGDNRQHSSDSRSSLIGIIDEDYILGVVKYRFVNIYKDEMTQKKKVSFYPASEWKIS